MTVYTRAHADAHFYSQIERNTAVSNGISAEPQPGRELGASALAPGDSSFAENLDPEKMTVEQVAQFFRQFSMLAVYCPAIRYHDVDVPMLIELCKKKSQDGLVSLGIEPILHQAKVLTELRKLQTRVSEEQRTVSARATTQVAPQPATKKGVTWADADESSAAGGKSCSLFHLLLMSFCIVLFCAWTAVWFLWSHFDTESFGMRAKPCDAD